MMKFSYLKAGDVANMDPEYLLALGSQSGGLPKCKGCGKKLFERSIFILTLILIRSSENNLEFK